MATHDLKVFISSRDSVCDECKESLGRRAWIMLADDRAYCLSCADLDHLVFLASGHTALTRRAKKHSNLSAVVLKFNRTRKRYERQGLLVEEEALAQAERECLADEDARRRRREREAERREELDAEYIESFAQRVRTLFPACPQDRESQIARHACQKYSGRVGRSAAAKNLDDEAVRFAVRAHIRHVETSYDRLLARGTDRHDARDQVRTDVEQLLQDWAQSTK